MQAVIDDFTLRKNETIKYFNFLEKVENDYRMLLHLDSTLPSYRIDDDHLKIFKANGFLILYNLIESTILNGVISIFDEIKIKSLTYKDVTEKIKKYWFKNLYKHDERIKEESLNNKFYVIVEEIIRNISLEIVKDRIEYGGSLDAARIRDIAESLGILLNEDHYDIEKHGKVLLNIKLNRNDLAHGTKSFSQIGKDITFNGITSLDDNENEKVDELGLKHFKEYTIEHLESFIINIKVFIEQEKYILSQ